MLGLRSMKRPSSSDDDGYSLIVTDINVPGHLDGIDLAAHARRKEPGMPPLARQDGIYACCDWALHMIAALPMGDFVHDNDEEWRPG